MGLHLHEAGEIPFGGVVLRQGDQADPEQRSENVSWACQGTARLRKVQKGAQDRGKMRGARLTLPAFFNVRNWTRLSTKRIFSKIFQNYSKFSLFEICFIIYQI